MKIVVLSFIIWRCVLIIIAGLIPLVVSPKPDFLGLQFAQGISYHFWYLANFDGEHYLSITKYGYKEFEYAFFPVFPLIIKLLTYLTQNVLLSGVIISTTSAALLLIILYKLFSLDYKEEKVLKGIILLLAFPTAFFLLSIYTESFFLCLVAGSFFLARKNKFLYAGLVGSLASATRLVGIFLLPALIIMWLRGERKWVDFFSILIIPLGLLTVMAFNFIQTGNPIFFISAQPNFGANRSGGEIILLPQVIYRYIKIFLTISPFSYAFFISIQEFIWTGIFIGLLIKFFKKMRPEYFVFSIGSLLIPTFTGTLSSMPRYALAAFPLFFLVPDVILKKYSFWIVFSLMLLLEVISTMLFVSGYWVS